MDVPQLMHNCKYPTIYQYPNNNNEKEAFQRCENEGFAKDGFMEFETPITSKNEQTFLNNLLNAHSLKAKKFEIIAN